MPTEVSVLLMALCAFGVKDYQVFGGPVWISSDR
jgi:hypothetical protein